jgi:TDG/mug DNA glycosylase family protein
VLQRTGLTPVRLAPGDYRNLLDYGIGLTDLVKTKAGMDAALQQADYDVPAFRARIVDHAPRVVAFNGKRAAKVALGGPIAYGRHGERIGRSAVFVLPSTSGAARRWWDEEKWRDLARLFAPIGSVR